MHSFTSHLEGDIAPRLEICLALATYGSVILANLSPKLTAALVGIGTMLSFITLPLLHQVL